MKLVKTINEVKQANNMLGLVRSQVVHDIKSSRGEASYTGPKIEPQEWRQVLALFQWTNKEHGSESQVRMYANAALNRVAFWAHPQQGRTGMTSKELDSTVEERKQDSIERFKFWGVPANGGWVYIGTVHHHCNCGAFQSGTDLENEQGQDGLHITIGNLSQSKFTFHARFYINGMEFNPDMSEFWDVGEPWNQLPKELLNYDAMARSQMCCPAPDDVEVPQAWKQNIRTIEITTPTRYFGIGDDADDQHSRFWDGYSPGCPMGRDNSDLVGTVENEWRIRKFSQIMDEYGLADVEARELLRLINTTPALYELVELLREAKGGLDEVLEFLSDWLTERFMRRTEEAEAKEWQQSNAADSASQK